MSFRAAVLGLVTLTACEKTVPPPPPAPEPPKAVVAPTRGATGDTDLRVMLSELASSKACPMIRGGFQGLRSSEHPDVVTGVLWIRECNISNVGLRVTFRIAGSGWLWVDKTAHKGGGAFVVRQYVRFNVASTIQGELDLAYDRGAHVATVWFTPNRAPEVDFKTIGEIEVDSEGVWSSVVGALGTAIASAPDAVALGEAAKKGSGDFSAELAKGIAVTVNLCTGLSRVHLGHPPKGDMGLAHVGESRRVPVELQPGGVMMIGPQIADRGMTIQTDALLGGVRMTLVCAKHAQTIASEIMAGRSVPVTPHLGFVDVRTKAKKLRIAPTTCPVVVVATPLDNVPARFAWERPTAEIARSTGGPLIRCERAAPKAKTTTKP